MENPGTDLSGWASVGGIVATIAVGAWSAIRLYAGQEKSAATQTRAEATDIYVRAGQESRDISRDALATLQTLLATSSAMKEMLVRIVIAQEEIVRLMRLQQEDARFAERTHHQLKELFDEEREKERERDRRERRD